MSKRISVPADLEHLIEKRDEESDRRSGNRRSTSRATGKVTADGNKAERRGQTDRRRKPRRRKSGS